jgi:hypothetical protein
MKSVLIITYFYHKKEEIGSIRIRGLAKFLPSFGWNPIILTLSSNQSNEHLDSILETKDIDSRERARNRLAKRIKEIINDRFDFIQLNEKRKFKDFLFFFIDEIITFPDEKISWRENALKSAIDYLEKENVDAMISSSYPPTTHFVAYDLKKKYGIPWVADLRDPWALNYYARHTFPRRLLDKRIQRKVLSKANVITAVSESLAEMLKRLNPKNKVAVIRNGFDPDMVNPETLDGDKFSISYTGFLYDGKRDPTMLFSAIKEIISEKKINPDDIIVNFYGPKAEWLRKRIESFDLQGIVKVYGQISREYAINIQRNSQLLLSLTTSDPKDSGGYTGKLFDYLAARRPIISIGVQGSVIQPLLKATNAGIHVTTVSEIKEVILRFYSEFKSKGTIRYGGSIERVNEYSQIEMAKSMAHFLDDISKKKQ